MVRFAADVAEYLTMAHLAQAVPTTVTGQEREVEVDRRYAALYRLAGAGALLTALLIPLQVVAFIVWPLPVGWRLVGLGRG